MALLNILGGGTVNKEPASTTDLNVQLASDPDSQRIEEVASRCASMDRVTEQVLQPSQDTINAKFACMKRSSLSPVLESDTEMQADNLEDGFASSATLDSIFDEVADATPVPGGVDSPVNQTNDTHEDTTTDATDIRESEVDATSIGSLVDASKSLSTRLSGRSSDPDTDELTEKLENMDIDVTAPCEIPYCSVSALPIASTYADALDLAIRYPDLSDHFLSTSLAGSSPMKNKSLSDLQATTERPNEDNPSDGTESPLPSRDASEKEQIIKNKAPDIPLTSDLPNSTEAQGNDAKPELVDANRAELNPRNSRGRGRSAPNRRGRRGGRAKPGPPQMHKLAETPTPPRLPPTGQQQNNGRGRRGSRIIPNRVFSQSTRLSPVSMSPRSQSASPSPTPPPVNSPSSSRRNQNRGQHPPAKPGNRSSRTPNAQHHHPPSGPSRHTAEHRSPPNTPTRGKPHRQHGQRIAMPQNSATLNQSPETSFHSRLARQLNQQTADVTVPNGYFAGFNQQNNIHMDRNIWTQYMNSIAQLYYPQIGNNTGPLSAGAERLLNLNAPHRHQESGDLFNSSLPSPPPPSPATASRYPNSALRQPRALTNYQVSRNPDFLQGQFESEPTSIAESTGRDFNGFSASPPNQFIPDGDAAQDLGSSSFSWRRATAAPQTTKHLSPMSSQQNIGPDFWSNHITSVSRMNEETFMAPQSRGRLDQSKGITPPNQGYRAISHTQRHS